MYFYNLFLLGQRTERNIISISALIFEIIIILKTSVIILIMAMKCLPLKFTV